MTEPVSLVVRYITQEGKLTREGYSLLTSLKAVEAGGAAVWGTITGAIGDQTDLQIALDGKSSASHNHSYPTLDDLPTLGTASAADVGDFAPFAHSHDYGDLTGLPALFSGVYGDLSGIPATFAPSAHTHAYASLTGLPTLGTAAAAATTDFATAAQGVLAGTASQPGHTHTLAAGATDVTITAANLNTLDDGVDTTLHFHAADRARAAHTGTQLAATISDFSTAADARVVAGITGKQDTLVSGTNIKTVNGSSLLGSGNLVISGGGGGYVSPLWSQLA